MSDQNISVIELVIATTALILLLAGFIITILYLYQKKQLLFQKDIEEIKLDHEKNILQTQLEIQEQTLQYVSRDIHDNIALGLTLSKLHLNTLNYPEPAPYQDKINLSINLIGDAIQSLSNISKSLNADIIKTFGLLKAVENEIVNIEKTGLFKIEYLVTGTPVFLDSKIELVIFRIIQESLNNIIKHSRAENVRIMLNYDISHLILSVTDDGIGFLFNKAHELKKCPGGAGLNNIQQRAKMIDSECRIVSKTSEGTMIVITTPLLQNKEK
jgi:two-component system NarL family sensor kinase